MLVLLRDHVLSANLALALMAVVAIVAAAGGRTAGVLAALTAALSYDFFLTEPYLTLRITDDDDIETTDHPARCRRRDGAVRGVGAQEPTGDASRSVRTRPSSASSRPRVAGCTTG